MYYTFLIICLIKTSYIYRNAKVENSIASPNLYILYTSFYANFGGYAIGILFGRIYYKYKYYKLNVDTVSINTMYL